MPPTRIRAKFYVAAVTKTAYNSGGVGEGGTVVLQAATRGAMNAAWASATPSGKIELTVNNPSAFRALDERIGQECYVDLDFDVAQPGDGHTFVASPANHYNHPRCAECGADEVSH